jgi:hypothetical protein
MAPKAVWRHMSSVFMPENYFIEQANVAIASQAFVLQELSSNPGRSTWLFFIELLNIIYSFVVLLFPSTWHPLSA